MSEIFLQIINMSISASYIVLAVLLLRLLLRKAPKWISVLLWGIVAVRLVCPFSKGSAVRRLKWYASWVQNVVRQFGPYLSWALDI